MNSEISDAIPTVDGADGASVDAQSGNTAAQSGLVASSSSTRAYQGDRRKPSLKSFLYGAVNPRRRKIRRDEDRDHTYLDWHPAHLILVCAVILSLSVIDGLLTVYLVVNGAKEFNPLMTLLGSNGPIFFALGKFLLTSVGVIGLVLTAHMKIYRFVKASTVLYLFLFVYLVLVAYQASLARVIV